MWSPARFCLPLCDLGKALTLPRSVSSPPGPSAGSASRCPGPLLLHPPSPTQPSHGSRPEIPLITDDSHMPPALASPEVLTRYPPACALSPPSRHLSVYRSSLTSGSSSCQPAANPRLHPPGSGKSILPGVLAKTLKSVFSFPLFHTLYPFLQQILWTSPSKIFPESDPLLCLPHNHGAETLSDTAASSEVSLILPLPLWPVLNPGETLLNVKQIMSLCSKPQELPVSRVKAKSRQWPMRSTFQPHLPLSPLTPSAPATRPPHCFLNAPGPLLPQGLCTALPSAWNVLPTNILLVHSLILFMSLH